MDKAEKNLDNGNAESLNSQVRGTQCPFCGRNNTAIYRLPDSSDRHVYCQICNASGPWGKSDKEARQAWAIRTDLTVAHAMYDALQFLLSDVQDYEAWQRPCASVDKARAALALARGEATNSLVSSGTAE